MLKFITRWLANRKRKFHKSTCVVKETPIAQKDVEDIPIQVEEVVHEELPLYTQEQYELFKECQIGDLLWALMPLPQEQLDKVAKDHQIRPYLIVKKEDDHLLAYASTSTSQHSEAYQYYCYHGYSHGAYKLAYIQLKTIYILPIQNLRTFMMQLSNQDLKNIEKRLLLHKPANRYLQCTPKTPIRYETGDIISIQTEQHIHYYYIYQDDQQNLYGLYLIKGSQRDAKYIITLHKVPYVIDFQRKQVINRKNSMKLIGILNSQQQEEIANIQKNLRRKRKNISRCTKEVAAAIQYTGCRYVDQEGDEYVFLYTWHDHRYGVCLNTFEQYPSIVRLKKNIPRLGRVTDEEVIAIIQRLKEKNADFHHQLDTTLALYKKDETPV